MKKYSSISRVIERMKKQMLTDRNLKKRVERVAGGVSKSQEQAPSHQVFETVKQG
ncbi:MAG: hypothetical protein LWX55_04140 [Deltaproteobacteria bacterium]|jgi:hypothetical protein|nr:hypothetical protein [Deltaproteobacteria bacterium]